MLDAVRSSRVGWSVGSENVPVQVIQASGLVLDGRITAQAPDWVGGGLLASHLGVLGAVGRGVIAQREDLVQVVDELAGRRRGVAAAAIVVLDHARGPFG